MGSGNSASSMFDDPSAVAAQSQQPGSDDTVAGEVGVRPSASRRADWAGVALVAVLAIAAMAPALRGTFLPGDDQHFVVNHVCVNRPGLLNNRLGRISGPQYYDAASPYSSRSESVSQPASRSSPSSRTSARINSSREWIRSRAAEK